MTMIEQRIQQEVTWFRSPCNQCQQVDIVGMEDVTVVFSRKVPSSHACLESQVTFVKETLIQDIKFQLCSYYFVLLHICSFFGIVLNVRCLNGTAVIVIVHTKDCSFDNAVSRHSGTISKMDIPSPAEKEKNLCITNTAPPIQGLQQTHCLCGFIS